MVVEKRRSQLVMVTAGIMVVSLLAAFISGLDFSARKQDALVGEVVLPRFEADVTAADQIKVTTKVGEYNLKREDREWYLQERGRYPIRLEAIANLSEALASMTYTRQMTVDPKKFDRLGLGDPFKEGTGALMQVIDENESSLVDLVVGFKNGSAYIREPEKVQTWAVDASVFPPLQNPARWLDLDIIPVGAGDIARVEIELANGKPYGLRVKPDAPGRFNLAEPYKKALLIADFAPNPPALALSRLSLLDARPRGEISGRAVATHRTITHLGLVIEAELFKQDGKYWVMFSQALQVERDETIDQLDAFESKVAEWAFEISRLDFNIMTTPLEDIAITQ